MITPRSTKYTVIALTVFTVVQAVLTTVNYKVEGDIYRLYQYLFIVACFLFALVNIKNKKYNFVVVTALAFTLFADYCLVVRRPMWQSLGTTVFVLVQIAYEIKLILETENKKINTAHVIVSGVGSVAVIGVAFLVLKDKADYLSIVSALYVTNLAVNILFAMLDFKTQNVFAVGLVFFIGCDILVGLAVADGTYFTVSGIFYRILHCGTDVSWILYRISQYLIAVSTLCLTGRKNKCKD